MDIRRNPQRRTSGGSSQPTPNAAKTRTPRAAITSSLMEDLNETLSQIDNDSSGIGERKTPKQTRKNGKKSKSLGLRNARLSPGQS